MRKIIYNSEAVIGDIKSERGKDETDIKIWVRLSVYDSGRFHISVM